LSYRNLLKLYPNIGVYQAQSLAGAKSLLILLALSKRLKSYPFTKQLPGWTTKLAILSFLPSSRRRARGQSAYFAQTASLEVAITRGVPARGE
jgi:hypothetical protein